MSASTATGADGASRTERADGTDAPAGAVPPGVWRIAAVVVLGAFMAGLDTSLVNVGLATIARSLRAGLGATQWVASGYLLALAASLPACGWLTRRFGASRVWLWALVGFVVTSGACALAPDLPLLVAARALQGAAGGLLVPAGQTVLGRAAGPRRMGRVMNTAGIAVVLAPAIGPSLGGLLIASASWRWLFLANLPVGAVAVVLGRRVLPRDPTGPAGRLDVAGLVLLGAGLPLLSYGIITTSQQDGAQRAAGIVALSAGAVAVAVFAVRALRERTDPARQPLLDLRLFAGRTYAAAQTTVALTGASLYGGLIVLPLYFEVLRGRGVVDTGLLLLAYGSGAACSLRLGGRLTDRVGGGLTATAGLLVTIAATVPFVALPAHASLVGVEALQFARGVGVSLAGLPAMSSAFAAVPAAKLPDATATATILQRVAGSLGSALFVVVLDAHHATTSAAFQHVFAWLSATAVLALAAASWLARTQRAATPRR